MFFRAVVAFVTIVMFSANIFAADIVLVKHAKRIKPDASEPYEIIEGDTLRSILMDIYKAKEEDLPSLYNKFRQENPQITNLDNIPAGTKIKIPIMGETMRTAQEKVSRQMEYEVKGVSANEYVIKQGEYLSKILKKVYGVPDELIFREYIDLVKKLNPEIKNPDHIEPGQKLKLPEIRQVMASARRVQKTQIPVASETTSGVRAEVRQQTLTAVQNEEQTSHPVSPPKLEVSKTEAPKPENKLPEAKQAPSQKPATESRQDQKVDKTDSVEKSDKSSNISKLEQPNKIEKPQTTKDIKHAVMPALKAMGGTQRDKGMYFMPMSGGSSMSINTSEVPVMELDTGRKIIFDLNKQITPEMKAYIEKAFPNFNVISGTPKDMEELMDKVLSVSGYFSINKDPSPLLIGSEEKLRFFGKWIVYKDFSRRNVFVINLLGNEEIKSPQAIKNYANNFGIDLIEVGGKDPAKIQKNAVQAIKLKHSYTSLFNYMKIPYEANKEIVLVSSGVMKISYKAPILLGKVILSDTLPGQDTLDMLTKLSYEVVNTKTAQMDEVIKKAGLEFEGPPLKMVVAKGRTELEIPAIKIDGNVILLSKIDKGIINYISASGMKVLVW